jgi:hypothetical protein
MHAFAQRDTLAIRHSIATALEPAPGESVVVEADSTPLIPGVVFYRGRRIPRIVSGEQARPHVVTVVASRSASVSVSSLSEIPRVWALACPALQSNDIAADTTVVLAILRMTGIRPEPYILRSRQQLEREGYATLVENQRALAQIAPPSLSQYDTTSVVRIFTDESRGIFANEFTLSRGCQMRVERHMITGYRGAFQIDLQLP